MRPINHGRRRRVLMLAKRLDELAAARRELLLQLETVDAQAVAVQLERNALHNIDAPIFILPDEVLAMIFEACMHTRDSRPQNASFDFGVLVSHVIQRWRNISIATPRLWTSIWCIKNRGHPPYPEGRVATFLSRARSLPLDIDITGFRDQEFFSNFLQLLSDHMGRCHRLRIDADDSVLKKVLKCISLQSMPLLESIDLESQDDALEFHEIIFRSGVPRLTTARIVDINFTTMHYCLPAFSSLISLQLPYIAYPDYGSFRDGLMALPSLRYLELYVVTFDIPSPPTHLPILLPNILHLHVQGNPGESPPAIYNLLSCIQAENLVALALSVVTAEEPIALNAHAFQPHFPSLQHLLLADVAHSAADLVAFARSFPNIGRLTFALVRNDGRLSLHNLNQTLGIIIPGAGDDAATEYNVHSVLLWSKLQSIALPMSTDHFSVTELESTKGTILRLQAAGHPIRQLLLPQNVHPAMVEMGEVIEIGEYHVDWPRVFNGT